MTDESTERSDGEPEGLDHALREVFGGKTASTEASVLKRLDPEERAIFRYGVRIRLDVVSAFL